MSFINMIVESLNSHQRNDNKIISMIDYIIDNLEGKSNYYYDVKRYLLGYLVWVMNMTELSDVGLVIKLNNNSLIN